MSGHRGLERVIGDLAGEGAHRHEVLAFGPEPAGTTADFDPGNRNNPDRHVLRHYRAPATAGATQVPRSSRAAGSNRTIRRPEPSGSGSRPLQPPSVCTQLT